MTQITVRDKIRKLVELQKLDGEIYRYKQQLEEKPARLQELKDQFENKKTRFKDLEQEYKTIQVKRNTLEKDLQAKEDMIAKANTQLSAIQTNKEYTAKIHEIESIKADKSLIEEKILLTYDEADQLKIVVEQEKTVVAKEEQQYLNEKKIVDEEIKNIQQQAQALESQRNEISPAIDKSLLARYERILINKHGLAIVPVIKGDVCGGCYMNVPTQMINQIRMNETLMMCEMCARILYLEEEL
ncbi:MAG: C4-type zinc ribbon domain-containing protein [Candidatus Omnitrophica bacterium]|nr:C4-type zinc ribbon domain-containing protein [Candidatus Omnitrophota bacterium]